MTTSEAFITLTDGRRLSYVDIGDHDGVPVISCHGGLSSGHDVIPAAEPAAELGIRVISPDRPGIGVAQIDNRAGLCSIGQRTSPNSQINWVCHPSP